jgi:hypothetical protein
VQCGFVIGIKENSCRVNKGLEISIIFCNRSGPAVFLCLMKYTFTLVRGAAVACAILVGIHSPIQAEDKKPGPRGPGGMVEKVEGNTITVKTRDGSKTLTLAPDAIIKLPGDKTGTVADIKPGTRIMGQGDPGSLKELRVMPPREGKERGEKGGKGGKSEKPSTPAEDESSEN